MDHTLHTLTSKIHAFTQQSAANRLLYTNALQNNQQSIIEYFGGIEKIVDICLSSQKDYHTINPGKLKQFEQMLVSNGVAINQQVQSRVRTHSTLHDLHSNSVRHFIKNQITVMIDPSSNLYSKFLSLEQQKYVIKYMITSKLYFILMCIIFGIFYSVSQTVWFINNSNYILSYFILVCCSYTVSTTLAISYILSADFDICLLIFRTFDFWYKVYNLILWIVASYICNIFPGTIHFTFTSISLVTVFVTTFLFDAIQMPTICKISTICIVSSYCIYNAIIAYLTIEDVYWDPFEQYNYNYNTAGIDRSYTRWNIKALFTSSCVNLILFIMKPIFSQIARYCCRKAKFAKKSKHDTNTINDRDVVDNYNCDDDQLERFSLIHRSYTLYKRPYLKWFKIKYENDDSNDNIMHNRVGSQSPPSSPTNHLKQIELVFAS